jgi:hypothetical protein
MTLAAGAAWSRWGQKPLDQDDRRWGSPQVRDGALTWKYKIISSCRLKIFNITGGYCTFTYEETPLIPHSVKDTVAPFI